MYRILTVIGARPQIIKAAAISRAIAIAYGERINEKILHTGQHYDKNMSKVFFEEMNVPSPAYNLKAGSGSHGAQTAAMIKGLEEVMLKEKPSGVIVYGDTNSTLAGAIAASKMHIPVIHIEAGLRSFNREMPEEINRVLCDHVSTLLFTPTEAGYRNLIAEGFKENNTSASFGSALDGSLSAGVKPYTINNPKIYHCGDVMYDNCLYFGERTENRPFRINGTDVTDSNYVLVTIHRDNNTDDPKRLSALFKSIIAISNDFNISVVLPLHPRTANLLKQNLEPDVYRDVKSNKYIKIIPAVSFLDMYTLEKGAKLIMTDSGGVQKEAFFFRKPCIILRPETEWVELVENGNAILCDANIKKITSAFSELTAKTNFTYPALFGDGKSALFICEKILETLSSKNDTDLLSGNNQ